MDVLSKIAKIKQNPAIMMEIDDDVLKKIIRHLRLKSSKNSHEILQFFVPGFDAVQYSIESFEGRNQNGFKSVSVSGRGCHLQCDHCKGILLEDMVDATELGLKETLEHLIDNGAKGFLISGGSSVNGKVPILPHVGEIKNIKKQHDVEIVIHSGFMAESEIGALQEAGIDGIMFDYMGDRATMKDVCHLPYSPIDYQSMVVSCKKFGIPVIPHVIVGLNWGSIVGEVDAISNLAQLKPDAIVMVILTPFKRTPMEKVNVSIHEVLRLLVLARLLSDGLPLELGCAKSSGDVRYEAERIAVQCGFNGIAFPLEETVELARKLNIPFEFREECCSLIYKQY